MSISLAVCDLWTLEGQSFSPTYKVIVYFLTTSDGKDIRCTQYLISQEVTFSLYRLHTADNLRSEGIIPYLSIRHIHMHTSPRSCWSPRPCSRMPHILDSVSYRDLLCWIPCCCWRGGRRFLPSLTFFRGQQLK